LSNIQAIERLREIGFRVEIIGYAKDELMEPYQAVIYDPSYQERSWGAFGSTIGEAVDGAIAKFKLEMQNKLEEVKQRYREADEKYVASLRKWREAVGTPLEDITWQESRRAYWNMRKAIREFYEAQYSCQV
jgi:DNA-binding transcriptional MerR regulator